MSAEDKIIGRMKTRMCHTAKKFPHQSCERGKNNQNEEMLRK
jgi:hypothetical protein